MTEEAGLKHVKFNNSTLIDIINNITNIKVTLQDLKGPSVEKITEIYKSFLKTCLNVDESIIENFTYEITSNFTEEVMAVQKNAFKRIQFYSLIYYLYEMASMRAHCSEIFFPQVHGKGLFTKQLSTLVTFARFEYIQLEDFSSIQKEFKQKSVDAAEIVANNSRLRAQISTLRQDKDERKIPVDNTKKRIAILNDRLAQLRGFTRRLDDDLNKLENECDAVNKDNEDKKAQMASHQKRNQFLDKMLIKSPEKLKSDIEKNKIKIADTQRMAQSKKTDIDRFTKSCSDAEKYLEGLKGVIMDNLETFYLNDIQTANEMVKEIDADKEERINLEFQFDQIESKIRAYTADIEKKKKEYERIRNEVESEMVALGEKDQSRLELLNKQEAMIKNIEKQISEMKFEDKEQLAQFEYQVEKKFKAIEFIQVQLQGLEFKKRVYDEMVNQLSSQLGKILEGEMAGVAADEEALCEILKLARV